MGGFLESVGILINIALVMYAIYSLERACRSRRARRKGQPTVSWVIDPPMLNQPVEDWKAHLKELEEIPVGAADILVLNGISYAREVIREKEAGELPY